MKLIVGLGNPGKKYENTRHNTGFNVLNLVANALNVEIDQIKFKGLYGQLIYKGEKVFLLQPQTFMNCSGESVRPFMDYFNIDTNDLLVVYDDLDLEVGMIRLRSFGSDGGQKGMHSIIANLGTNRFKRIRVGIGNNKQIPTADYVLGKVSKDEKEDYDKAINFAKDAIIDFLNEDFNLVMNKFNKKKSRDD